jgi:hypothetical protein
MRPRLAALLTVFIVPAAFGYTADELAAKNVEAKGGLDNIHAIKSLRLTGSMRIQQDTLELGFVTLVKQPGSVRYEAALQGLTQVQAFDGKQAWQINPFQGRKDPENLSADDAKGLGEDAADFAGPLVDYEAKGYKLAYLGLEDIDGTDAYKLRITRTNGDVTTVYLDPDYFLDIRAVNRRVEHGVPVETVVNYGDYEKVGGVFLAFSQESGVKGSNERQKVQFEKGEANVDIADGLFHVPAVKAAGATGK